MERLKCLPPLVCKSTHTLILGTFPSKESLQKQQYYANPKNHFWDFLFRIYDSTWDCFELVGTKVHYDAKVKLLFDNGLGLWDIIESCEREGSSDKKIKNEIYNKLNKFLIDYPQIKRLILTNKSLEYLKKSGELPSDKYQLIVLDSTSSLNPNNTFYVLRQWMHALNLLDFVSNT